MRHAVKVTIITSQAIRKTRRGNEKKRTKKVKLAVKIAPRVTALR